MTTSSSCESRSKSGSSMSRPKLASARFSTSSRVEHSARRRLVSQRDGSPRQRRHHPPPRLPHGDALHRTSDAGSLRPARDAARPLQARISADAAQRAAARPHHAVGEARDHGARRRPRLPPEVPPGTRPARQPRPQGAGHAGCPPAWPRPHAADDAAVDAERAQGSRARAARPPRGVELRRVDRAGAEPGGGQPAARARRRALSRDDGPLRR